MFISGLESQEQAGFDRLHSWLSRLPELGFPDKADQRAEPGSGWTPAELNHILQAHVVDVDGALSTFGTKFGCVEWESELCGGVMRARCYPFDIPKHCFHGMNPKVQFIQNTNMYIHVIYMYMLVYNLYIHGIYNVQVCMYLILTELPA